MYKRIPHPSKKEAQDLGYKGILKKYGSYEQASLKLGVTAQTIYNWAPVPADKVKRYRQRNLAQLSEPADPRFPDLPPRAARVLRILVELMRKGGGCPPTMREIKEACGFASTNGVNDHVNVLEREGYVVRSGGGMRTRCLRLTEKAGAAPEVPREAIQHLARLSLRSCDPKGPSFTHAKTVLAWLEAIK